MRGVGHFEMALRPQETIQKALISTTSHLVGEYEKNGLLLTHAWPDFYDRAASVRWSEGPTSRSAFIFAFETVPIDKKSGPLPEYSPMGELICAYLAVLFGKRFDSLSFPLFSVFQGAAIMLPSSAQAEC